MEKTILYHEIHQQPNVIHNLVNNEFKTIQNIASVLNGKFNYIVIAARGTSDNAARYAQYLFGIENHIQVALATPSLFSIYKQKPNLKGALVIGISQSGQSPDIISVIDEARSQNCPTLAISNFPDSPLADASDYLINLHAGLEKSIAATKTYTASLAALALLSTAFSNNQKHLAEILELPNIIENCFGDFETHIDGVTRYRYIDRCIVLGRGLNYSTSFEIALKIKELTGIVTESFSTADFKHGPIATVSKGFPVILVAPKGKMAKDLVSMQNSIDEKNAEIIAISNDQIILKKAKLPLPLPQSLPEWLSPILAVIPGQLFALKLAFERGLDPDHPLGLTKVTQTL